MTQKLVKAAFLPMVALLLYLLGCPMYTAVAFKYAKAGGGSEGGAEVAEDPSAVISSAESITLAWDPSPSAVTLYRLYFRIHDTSTWYSLPDSAEAVPSPEYKVSHTGIEPGPYDFGVKAVNAEDFESNMHMSIDATAEPDTGWYLIWE